MIRYLLVNVKAPNFYTLTIVLGGYVGSSMEPYIQEFRNLVAEKDIFENSGDYVYVCQYQQEASALGAAIFQIEKFIDTI